MYKIEYFKLYLTSKTSNILQYKQTLVVHLMIHVGFTFLVHNPTTIHEERKQSAISRFWLKGETVSTSNDPFDQRL